MATNSVETTEERDEGEESYLFQVVARPGVARIIVDDGDSFWANFSSLQSSILG
ncbi:hypothetical protein GBA52_010611 [Prunus armeniaca]|nr:hypothetical protein GBA52_010611 [Prunus armeniaca]